MPTSDLMDDQEAVQAVCDLGKRLEREAMDAEAEAFIRSWRAMPNGGHDPGFVRWLREEAGMAR
jgi:hypothetical protein